MNMSRTTALLVSVVVSGAALAEETGAAKVPTRETYPAALVERPLTLAAGVADVVGTLALNLDRLEKPIATFPGLAYGLSDGLTASLFTGFCIDRSWDGCGGHVFEGAGGGAVLSLLRTGSTQIVGETALGVARPSDARMSVGAAAKTTLGRFALVWDVTIFSRLNHFEHADNTTFAATLQPQMQLTDWLAAFGSIGFVAPFDHLGRNSIPRQVGLLVTPTRNLDIGVAVHPGDLGVLSASLRL
jgi:hypothetical protein